MTRMKDKLDTVIEALTAAGYEPYVQLYGYLKTGDVTYITRRNNARDLIKEISKEDITKYVESLSP